ncbi:hypothetical protein [Thalassovita aquimarina]|uniref:hypothetical protein n=1 Tax=Thalassovita aquimarina TaxID=2785917 RepID=UPI0031BBA7C2
MPPNACPRRRCSGDKRSAAEEYLAHRELSQMTDLRFDVALVDGAGAIEVLENAFGHF